MKSPVLAEGPNLQGGGREAPTRTRGGGGHPDPGPSLAPAPTPPLRKLQDEYHEAKAGDLAQKLQHESRMFRAQRVSDRHSNLSPTDLLAVRLIPCSPHAIRSPASSEQ